MFIWRKKNNLNEYKETNDFKHNKKDNNGQDELTPFEYLTVEEILIFEKHFDIYSLDSSSDEETCTNNKTNCEENIIDNKKDIQIDNSKKKKL